jgi:SAM-dependent methyltransferase
MRQCQSVLGDTFEEQLRGKLVLDVGCGGGAAVLAYAQFARMSVGVDPASSIAAGVAPVMASLSGRAAFVRGIVGLFPEASFDLVVSHDAFEHLGDPGRELREMVRVTRPGGRVVVKFGPTWSGPHGRHMSGTYRKDRPWLHLMLPERSVMRVWSVYNDWPETLERYQDLPGGMNKMTVKRCETTFAVTEGIRVDETEISTFHNLPFRRIPILRELFSTAVTVRAVRCDDDEGHAKSST